jgi:hypothetical protein
MKRIYKGSCHCGRVRFECEVDLAGGTSKCNCSICTKSRFSKAIVRADARTSPRRADSRWRRCFSHGIWTAPRLPLSLARISATAAVKSRRRTDR